MSRFQPIDMTQVELPRPWYTLPSSIPPLMPPLGHSVPPAPVAGFSLPPTSGQVAPTVDDEQSVQQTERPWINRILRGPQEPVDFYIARMEAECSHKPRPVRAQGESAEDYAQRLWLRVYNKYCKRRSRHNERANYDQDSNGNPNDGNDSRSGRSQPQSRRQSVGPFHSNGQAANSGYGHSNARQVPSLGSHNDQNGRVAVDTQRMILAQAAAGARLQEHVSERARQAVHMEQFFRMALDIPSHETVFDGTTSRFHGSFAEIANFMNLDQGGARMVLRQDQSNTGLQTPPQESVYTSGSGHTMINSVRNALIDDEVDANDKSSGMTVLQPITDEEFAHLLVFFNCNR